MKQPELGIKVAQLRQQLNITQEQLAAECEVSTRTIQRIESGEVDPRSFTIERLSTALEFDFGADEIANEMIWLTALHISSIFSIILMPLIIWSIYKNRSHKIDRHGRDVLNFQITINLLLIFGVIVLVITPMILLIGADSETALKSVRLFLVLFSFVPLVLVGFFSAWQGVINTIRVANGRPYKYPLSIPFIR